MIFSSKKKIVLLGYIVRGPLGGLVWHHLQYVAGLKKMGHEVLFLEDSGDFPGCYNPETFELTEDPSYGLQFLKNIFSVFDLHSDWAYYDAHKNTWHGRSMQQVLNFCNSADMVIDLSGVNEARDWWTNISVRGLIDTDPAFTQIRHLTGEKDMQVAKLHTHFFSYGENFGKEGCLIPDDGFAWKGTRQPVVLDIWKKNGEGREGKWTTVMQWDSYKEREYNNIKFGMKSASFPPFASLPELMPGEEFELALGSPGAPVDELKSKGWDIIDPLLPTKEPSAYQKYIARSKGEWTVAKQGYVISKGGWFSERSAGYLASARPVVVQDTGFGNILPTGEGLLCFSNIDEAVQQLEKVNKDYAFHCRRAREVASDYFDSSKVLSQLLNDMND